MNMNRCGELVNGYFRDSAIFLSNRLLRLACGLLRLSLAALLVSKSGEGRLMIRPSFFIGHNEYTQDSPQELQILEVSQGISRRALSIA